MISVIIPVYNVEAYLKECVDSVLAQTYLDYEIILVDDGATDRSGQICDDYAQMDQRVRVIHQKNGGLSAARNTGMKAALGEYILFLDSDDYLLVNSLQDLHAHAVENQADVVFFDGFVFYDGCEPNDADIRYSRKKRYKTENGRSILYKQLKHEEYRTAVPLMLFRRQYLSDHKLTFMEGILHEDELFTYLVYNADGMVAHCHEELYARRMRPGSIMTASKMIRRYDSFLKIYYELEKLYDQGKSSGAAADFYMIRTAKSLWGMYQKLDEVGKEKAKDNYQKFRRSVLKHKGYGDWKLKIKCSDGIRNIFYRLQYKMIRTKKR